MVNISRSVEDKIVVWVSHTGHTIQDLADMIGISKSALDSKRAGRTSYLDKELIAMCEIFELTPNELLDYPTN